MDPEAFLDLANQVIKLKMYPYFDIAHSLLCALAVREDLGAGKCFILFLKRARQKYPFDQLPHPLLYKTRRRQNILWPEMY